ncbi:uncharacterized protein LOC6544684 [Drosophila erecta]|nr:uncharacterized protein LOC6544684 [Drosophila erecta]
MKATLLTVVALTAVAALVGAADPECIYRRTRKLPMHWPKPLNCSSYYRCTTKNAVRMVTCAPGKEYNPKNGKCITAGRGLCKLSLIAPLADSTNVCSTEVNGAYIAKSGSCGEFFICDEQYAYPQKCDLGSYFNETQAACVPDTSTTCWQNLCINQTTSAYLPNEANCGSYYECSDGEATLQTCPQGSFFNTSADACTVDEGNSQCWVNFCIGQTNGFSVADKSNCSMFYVCFNNTATAQECPEGSYFEDNNWGCVPGTCTTEAPCDDSTTTTTEPCDEVTTEPPASGDCGDIKNADFIPDEDNCRKYFICIDGVLEAGDCGKGNFFNATLSVCQVDADNTCCVADCTEGDAQVDPQDCTKYFKCQSGDWTSVSCDSGSYFNATLSCCQVDVNNVCINASGTSTQRPTTSTAIAISKCNARDPPASGKNCWTYQTCINGQWQDGTCRSNTYFNASVGICREDTDNVCPENRSSGSRQKRSVEDCTCEGGIKQGAIVGHSTDCDKYLICENGELVEGVCGFGNVFQSSSGTCVPDTKATCWICSNKPNGYQMASAIDCTSYFTCWNGQATKHTCGSGEWYNADGMCAIDVTGKCINPCTSCGGNGNGDSNVAHPICTKYFHCTDGVPQVVDCASGEAFDSATGQCSTTVECSAKKCATASDGTTYPVAGEDGQFYVCLDHEAVIESCPANTVYIDLGICQPQPSTDCDQTVCNATTLNWTYPSQNKDSSTFCLCEEDGGYIKSCAAGLFYDEAEGACTFSGNCDPRVCTGKLDFYVSPDFEDQNSFCLCRAGDPISVPCPIGYTFSSEDLECVLIPLPDPRCCANGCVGKTDFSTFPANEGTDGFCLCVAEVPKYKTCPKNAEFDAELGACISTGEETTCPVNACDADICEDALEYSTFPVSSDPSAFCYCDNFCPIYKTCSKGQVYDEYLNICTEAEDPCIASKCNAQKCESTPDFTPYLPNEGTDGFCYCIGGLPTYRACEENEEFDPTMGACLAVADASARALCDADLCATLGNNVPFPKNAGGHENAAFCYCQMGVVALAHCSPEMVFDEQEGRCAVQAASVSVCEPGKCDSSDEYKTYAALNTTEGFCLCVSGAPVFKRCLRDQSYDSFRRTCLSAANIGQFGLCDDRRCGSRATSTFAALNTTNGYCSCQDVGVSTFIRCADEHIYDSSAGTCVVEAEKEATAMISCNLKECLRRGQYEPFAAENTRSGFCSCDDTRRVSVTYHPCGEGETFVPELGTCDSHSIQKRSVESEENTCISDEKRSVPANCSQYEVCVDGHWRRRTCSDQRYYNPEQQRCLEPRDDLVCAYARVSHVPTCSSINESLTIPAKSGNCLQYFRCSGGKWRLRNCPRQHYYSSLIESCLPFPRGHEQDRNQTICNWAMSKQAGNTSEDCQHLAVRPSLAGGCQSYLMCLDNSWWLHQCPLGMYFSRQHNYCLPNDAGMCFLPAERRGNCSNGESRSVVGSCHSYELCSGGQWRRRRCQEREQFEPMLGCVPSDGSCQDNGMRRICQEGQLQAQFGNNCSQGFLYCEAEQWRLGSCLKGHSFARNRNKCQLQSQCQLQLRDLPAENRCVGQMDGLSVPDPTDCTRFYLCLQQVPTILQSCSSGSFFDSTQGYCRPNDGSCQLAICSGQEDGKLVAHPEDCRSYYSCSRRNGTSLVQCDEGQYFHSLLSICRADHGQCRNVPNQDDTETAPRLCSGLHGAKLPHERYCNLYYACVKGLAFPVECPLQHQFNPVLSMCEPESQAVQPCPSGHLDGNVSYVYSCGDLQDGTFLANRTDCTRYFICAGGVATAQRCAAGSFFDSAQLLCLTDDGSCPLVESVPDDDDKPNNQHVPPDPVVCEGKHGYIMLDPANCNNFYLCVSGKLRHELCYTDHFFNATLQQCQPYEMTSDGNNQTESPLQLRQIEPGRQESAVTNGSCKDAPTSFVGICGVIGNGASVAEQGDCRRYTSCEDDEPVSQRCRNGESFDSLLGICRQSDGTCLLENGERVGVCNGKHGQLARDADNCRGYFTCVHGQQIDGECAQGEFFSRVTSSCEVDVLQQCKSEADDVIIADNQG